MFHKLRPVLIAVLVAMLVVVPAAAVTDGELDGDGHPYVGLMVAKDANGIALWRCSGTLLSPTIYLTAGHCTEAPAVSATIWFESDVEGIIPSNDEDDTNDYPLGGPTTVNGTTYTHPQYNPAAFFLYDLGVVVLDEPYTAYTGDFPTLPALDQLDQLARRRGKQDVTFTAVGYGLQRINPVFVEAERVRMYAEPHLIQINAPGFTGDFSLLLSNNHSTGGTCFGDSGGPNFLGAYDADEKVIAGVTSFGLNGNCAGTGGVYRIDRADDLNWINDVLNGNLN